MEDKRVFGSIIARVDNFVEGKLQKRWKKRGASKIYRDNGQLSFISNYWDGKRNGLQKYYDENGYLDSTYN